MILSNAQQKLKTILADTIEQFIDSNEVGEIMGVYLANRTMELMTDAAFNILLAIKDLTEYCQENNDGQV